MIEKLKVNRVVVLTTHAMEEADALGDTIGILSQGRLRAVGSSLFLKSRFGAGYQVRQREGCTCACVLTTVAASYNTFEFV